MADMATHRQLAEGLLQAARRAESAKQWPITIDASFYAVFHLMEALNAMDCTDSYNFADADDILHHCLSPELGDRFVRDYRYLFYFRRGVIYGQHFPSEKQVTRYLQKCEANYEHVLAVLNQRRESEDGGRTRA
jgi:hypothetical protein